MLPTDDPARLTRTRDWDEHWDSVTLPAYYDLQDGGVANSQTGEILRLFDTYFPAAAETSILEIGGAPGQYLASIRRRRECRVAALDYSPIGCAKTHENFRLLKLPIDVHERDLFGDNSDLAPFDVVYSLGFLEHFTDPADVMRRHAQFLRPGGILLVGVPSFLGINGFLVERLCPSLVPIHHLPTMDLANWPAFEDGLGLECLFRQYIGGFEHRMYWRNEHPTVVNRALRLLVRAGGWVYSRTPLKRYNARWISGYAVGVWRKRASSSA